MDATQEIVALVLNGRWITAREGQNLLEVIRTKGVTIPAPCYRPGFERGPRCRLCLVEINGASDLRTACTETVTPGMTVRTETPEIELARKINLKSLSRHLREDLCGECIWDRTCEFYRLAREYGISIAPEDR